MVFERRRETPRRENADRRLGPETAGEADRCTPCYRFEDGPTRPLFRHRHIALSPTRT
ncbi:hypothetical protein HSR121_2151 [Halapricum desulfuricans]|uniref:Uncharacterized protein n=1 Tax=Halapricum desulfuricans TaxID=2841257 RepID=A0A897N1U0_9EURY|nr:hypothetical protein HSR121_2151 [Halapricum desulfuricans]